MKNPAKIFLLLFFLQFASFAQNNDICSYIKVLASDSLGGRKPGTAGGDMAAAYIQRQFSDDHLKLLFDKGFQYFDVVTDVELGDNNSLTFNDNGFNVRTDYIPYSFSKNTMLDAPCVFAGYGMTINKDSLKWDDYKDMDVKGKWVLVIRGDPEINKKISRFSDYSSDRSKMLNAKDHGAAGILLVAGMNMGKDDALVTLDYEKNHACADIAVINVSRNTADKILNSYGKTVKRLEHIIDSTMQPISFRLDGIIKANISIVQKKITTANVVAACMSEQPTDDYIVIGAHYDHLGMGGRTSGSRNPDTVAIHNGADDNASGTALMMWLAKHYSAVKLKGKYNIIFVAFSAEEMGLLGSSWFVGHLPAGKKNIKLMMNFDMVGRLNEHKALSVGGAGTFADAQRILKQDVDSTVLDLILSKEGYGPSDHATFYGDSIPVLYFNTGVHADYHLPSDDYDKINCKGVQTIAGFAVKVIDDICTSKYDLSYREAGPKNKSGNRTGLKVTLGIMPDFSLKDVQGVGVAAVNSEGPAQRGGMKKGDVIISVDGKAVNDIYEYMERLKTLSAGQLVTVEVMRGGKKEVLYIQL